MTEGTHRITEKGFTLIELLIVVVIIGVLAAVAYPSYRSYSLKGKRTEAIAALADIAGAQEKFYAGNLRYAATISNLEGYSVDPYITPGGLYSITTSGGNSYTLTANAQGSQTEDSACTTIRLFSTGAKTPAECW
jgi:type IV pilus assembly protein PilE